MRTFIAPLLKSDASPIVAPSGIPIHWMDWFLSGGLHRPPDLGRPLIVLLAGPPGAGKSLFVQQICYSRARQCCSQLGAPDQSPDAISAIQATSLVISTEASANSILSNLQSLGFQQFSGPHATRTYVYDGLKQNGELSGFAPQGGENPLMFVTAVPAVLSGQTKTSDLLDGIDRAWRDARKKLALIPEIPSLIAIDSLNVLAQGQSRGELFTQILQLFGGGPQFLFLVLDTASPLGSTPHDYEYWEYVADASLRLDYRYDQHDYFTRQLEISKLRFQPHSIGKQLAKIFRKPDIPVNGNLAVDPEGPRPNLPQGGLFVFPSLHFVLSQVRTRQMLVKVEPQALSAGSGRRPAYPNAPAPWGPRETPTDPDSINWPVKWVYELVGGGMPRHHCTAVIGFRGARKGYFAYQFLLDGIANGERTLIISFRDNPNEIAATLRTIQQAPQYGGMVFAPNNPVVVYQRPGYVTPEEVLHRVITAIGEYSPTRAVLNSVDQWDAANPLLAGSSIFLPTLIDFLNVHQVTSMIIGVEGNRKPLAEHGLAAKAEVVLSFEYRRIPWWTPSSSSALTTRPSRGPRDDGFPKDVPLAVPPPALPGGFSTQPKVVVRAVRVPRAAAGFGRAVLDYTQSASGAPAGLEMMPIAPEVDEGTII